MQTAGIRAAAFFFLCAALASGASAQAPASATAPMAAVGAGTACEFQTLWPASPQDWYFNQPTGVATDKAGNVYVMDGLNSRVQKLRPRQSANGKAEQELSEVPYTSPRSLVKTCSARDDDGPMRISSCPS